MDSSALRAILVIFIPLALSPFCYLIEKISPKLRTAYALILGFVTAGLTLSLIPSISKGNAESILWIPGADRIRFSICLDSLSVSVAVVAGVIGALVLLYSTKYMKPHEQEYSLSRYYWQTLLFIGGMIGLALSSNLLVMYVFWEIIGFCSYALIAYYYREPGVVGAGIKAFIVTRIGDIGFLVGILVLWRATGTLNLFEVIDASHRGLISFSLLSLAGAGFLAGAIGKSAQFPLHVWLPDAMVAPTTITALIHAACLVNAGVYLLGRSYPVFASLSWWPITVAWVGAVTALGAATVALTEWDIKRVLAYSTISQLGYMVAAIGAGAILAGQFHLVSHGIFKALLFLCAGSIMHMMGGVKDLRQMGGLANYMPFTHITFAFGLLSLVGIPVWTGFFSKDLILADMHQAGVYGPLVLLIIAAFFTAAYSWRMYWLAFRGEKRSTVEVRESPPEMTIPLAILALGSILFWLCISPYTASMSSSLSKLYLVSHISLSGLLHHTFLSSTVWITVAVVIFLIILTIEWRAFVLSSFERPSAATLPLLRAYWVDIFYNRVILRGFLGFCQVFRRLQTGNLNYNNLAIVIGFIVFLILLIAFGVPS